MNMRTTLAYNSESIHSLETKSEQIHITEALNLLNNVRNGALNSLLLTEIKGAETRLLQMKEDGIEYVSGSLLVMLKNLNNIGSIPLTGITQVFTATNDGSYSG